ncbi:right-handed parallel beta-helix repeat-containing protein [Klebsiella michiganensis]|uniref:right-handed parallel beta-helix repeat-containing protein n=3 Tax=Klebsiella michiganensis TaxID=1134687 RepID=UPI0012FD8C04|nr:right-handed parallel beta-helix repeat-containing protein [Klebsiella michiganensis]UHD29774.1 right-handed parallel beta-helix repeat-containing protein [Klebsiella michiganensis]ULF56137.1 right-handed parallel beta-helix repeat-containing protein [Klebsiella michiganensis]
MADNEKLGSTSPQVLLKNATNLDKLVNGRESESLPDRFAVLRRTWYGMEMAFNRFITYITGRGEQAVGAIGWQELGNWATGLTVDNRQQIVYYNGSWYKYLGELEHVITGDSPENDGGVWSAENPTGKWSNIGDAALRSNLGSDEGFKLIGQVHSAAALSALPGSEGERVLLLGYNPGWAASSSELSGGGEFHYVSSLADVNNGVTIFNGWCRKFTDTVITTYDAGLGDNDGVDARERLTTLFKVVPDGFTVKIRGYHLTSGPVKCEGKTDLTIDGMNGVISAKELRDVYTVYDVAETDPRVAMTGVLSCLDCPGIKIFGLEIQGAMKLSTTNDDGTHKGEEYALFIRACDGGEIYGTQLHNVFGYGCRGLYQSNVKFHHNYVHHCLRESGVNLVTGGSHGYIYCNRFEYIGLYGVEVEGQPYYSGMTKVKVWGNFISYTFRGICVVDQCLESEINDNTVSFSHTALSAYRTSDYAIRSTAFKVNTVLSCARGMFANGARNATFSDNDIDLIDVPEYLYTSPYNNIFEIDQTNRAVFWSPYLAEFQHLIGDNIKFDDVVYSVSAVEWDSTKTGYPKDDSSHPDGMWKVTLTSTLPEELDDTVSLAMTQNFGNTIGYQSAGNIHGVTASNNKIKNAYYALYCASSLIAGESGVQETVTGNTINGSTIWLTVSGSGFRLIDRNEPNANATVTASLWTTAGFKDVRMRNTMGISLPARTVNTSLLKPRLYSQISRRAVGVRITLLNTSPTNQWTGTGTLQVTLNDQVVVGSGNFTQGSEDPIQLFTQMEVKEGSNTIQVNTSNNDLLYAACQIELLIP